MGVSVEGQKCPVCHGYLFSDDDIVFCPVCGAPHHRDCYNSLGHCALEEKHGTPEEYKRPEVSNENSENSNSEEGAEKSERQNTDTENTIVCKNCGTQFSSRQPVCPNCGAINRPAAFVPFGVPLQFDPYGGVNPDEKLEDVPAKEIAQFVAVNTPRYVPKFFRLRSKKRLSWNWAAFFFPNAWFFYRKMYYQGTFFFLLMLITGAMTASFNFILQKLPSEALKSTAAAQNYIIQHPEIIDRNILIIFGIGVLLSIAMRVVAALFGDWIYRGSVLSKMHNIKKQETEEPFLLIQKRGGVNIFMGLFGLFATDWLVNILYMFI